MNVRRNVPKRLVVAAAGLALAGGLAVAPAASAAQSSAGDVHAMGCSKKWHEIHINGGSAKYRECTKKSGGHWYVSGTFYLWDTKHDGKAVQAYAETDYNHWYGDDTTWQHFYYWSSEKHHSPAVRTGWHRGDDFELRIQLK